LEVGGAASIIAGVGILAFGIGLVQKLGGFGQNGLTPMGWLGTVVLGFAFVLLQSVGTAALASVTLRSHEASSPRETENTGSKNE
jgi:hypothetical protein